MHSQIEHPNLLNPEDAIMDERGLLLEEVNFKWLMAGLGWWVDMSRFRIDRLYAAHFLQLASTSESAELRKCATLLEPRRGST
jgi:hypothetical protein